MNIILKTLAGLIAAPLVAILSYAGYTTPTLDQVPVRAPIEQSLGSTNAIETPVALFSTSLANGISSSATTMNLVSATIKDGTTLASSTYSFIIDEGTATEELVKADCTATVCTNMDRGLSALTGTTTVSGLAFSHRRGSSVKITDAPLLLNLTRIINGIGNFPNPIQYSSSLATTTLASNRNYIPSVGLVQDIAFNGAGVINAATGAKGVVQLPTQVQVASSTLLGSTGASLAIPSSYATSTYNSATAPLRVVVTQNNGKIDSNFIATSTLGLLNNATFTGTTTLATTTVTGSSNIASTTIVSFTGSGTWTKKSNLRYIIVEAVGGGGGSSGVNNNGSGGGGAGGYSKKIILASALGSTETVTIGAAGTGGSFNDVTPATNGGNTTFGSHLTAGGGTKSSYSAPTTPGTGGTSTGGDINITGGSGAPTSGSTFYGLGGSSYFGGSGAYGSGADGVRSAGAQAGNTGQAGFLTVTEIYY